MTVNLWKWLLQELEDETLSKMAKMLKIRIPGFRGYNWDRSIKLLRPRIIQSMLQQRQQPRLREVADQLIQSDPATILLRELSQEQLLEQIPGQYAPAPALLALLASEDAIVVAKGEALFQRWQELNLLSEWSALGADAAACEAEQAELDGYRRQVAELTAQLKKQEKQVKTLVAELEKEQARSGLTKKNWQQERKRLARRLTERETALNLCEEQLTAQTDELQEQARLITRLQATEVAGRGERSVTGGQPDRLTVAVVGNLQQINMSLPDHSDYKLLHIIPSELQQEQVLTSLQSCDQVWLLTYATPLPMQRRLRQAVSPDRLTCFATYQDYMSNLGQGV